MTSAIQATTAVAAPAAPSRPAAADPATTSFAEVLRGATQNEAPAAGSEPRDEAPANDAGDEATQATPASPERSERSERRAAPPADEPADSAEPAAPAASDATAPNAADQVAAAASAPVVLELDLSIRPIATPATSEASPALPPLATAVRAHPVPAGFEPRAKAAALAPALVATVTADDSNAGAQAVPAASANTVPAVPANDAPAAPAAAAPAARVSPAPAASVEAPAAPPAPATPEPTADSVSDPAAAAPPTTPADPTPAAQPAADEPAPAPSLSTNAPQASPGPAQQTAAVPAQAAPTTTAAVPAQAAPIATAALPPSVLPAPNAGPRSKPAKPARGDDDDGDDGPRVKPAYGGHRPFGHETSGAAEASKPGPAELFFTQGQGDPAPAVIGATTAATASLSPAAAHAHAAGLASVLPGQTASAADHAAAEVSTSAIADLVTPARFERMLDQLHGELQTGKNEFRLALEPVELGRVDVNIAARGEGVVVKLTAERGDVAHWLRTDLPILQKAIEQDGLQVLGVEVRSWTDLESRARDQHREPAPFTDDPAGAGSRPKSSIHHRFSPLARAASAAAGGLDLFV